VPEQLHRRTMATIPNPQDNVPSLRATAEAMKELVEVLTGQRGRPGSAAVTWDDLVRLGLIVPDQIPRDIGSHSL